MRSKVVMDLIRNPG